MNRCGFQWYDARGRVGARQIHSCILPPGHHTDGPHAHLAAGGPVYTVGLHEAVPVDDGEMGTVEISPQRAFESIWGYIVSDYPDSTINEQQPFADIVRKALTAAQEAADAHTAALAMYKARRLRGPRADAVRDRLTDALDALKKAMYS